MSEVKKFEGYFKKSIKQGCENVYIQKIFENGVLHIVVSNKMPKAGYYECEIMPMKMPKKGYIVVSFIHNPEKEKQSYQKYLQNKKIRMKKNAKFENKKIKDTINDKTIINERE